jgi:hypothetical protein
MITLDGTTGITTPDIDSTAGFDGEDLTGDVAAARITGALNATGSAPIYACRAWVNFNGIGTVAIRASGNVSSLTDNGTGNYTVNFTTSMQDANYSAVFSAGIDSGSTGNGLYAAKQSSASTTSTQLQFGRPDNGALADSDRVNVAIFR